MTSSIASGSVRFRPGRARSPAFAGPRHLVPLVATLGLVMLGWSDEIAIDRTIVAADAETMHAAPRAPARPPIRGTDFPDGVLALTWDDGPDASTLDLARYLRSERVSGSFFVVGEWVDGVSEEPGVGKEVFGGGYRHLPILTDLVALGHRLGGHTENHVLLGLAATSAVAEQIGQGMHEIDPLLSNELRMFRAPGGAFGRADADALADPFLGDLVGPIHWDIDAKDWEGSLYCRSTLPAECEPGPIPGRARVRAEVVARRYVALAERLRRGIVLMHDRVGDVGSRYAYDVARRVVPELTARGFVFAAPILAFGAPSPREHGANGTHRAPPDPSAVHFADLDGDGRDDLCREDGGVISCARATSGRTDARSVPRAGFEASRVVARIPGGARAVDIADVDGDRHADICVLTDQAIECALGRDDLAFGPFHVWSAELTPLRRSVYARSFRLADLDGDGRADVCVRSGEGISCAASAPSGDTFARPHLWFAGSVPDDGSRLELADLDRDGRADVCGSLPQDRHPGASGSSTSAVRCALSNGHGFGHAASWSALGDFPARTSMKLADINRDGRADICALGASGLSCALSDGVRFKRSSVWSETRSAAIALADINGDARADLCVVGSDGVDCGLAP